MRKIIAENDKSIAGSVGQLSDAHFRRTQARFKKTWGVINLPHIAETLPGPKVFIRKGAEKGKLLSDNLRDKLATDLREAMEQFHTKTKLPGYLYRRGKLKGQMDPRLVELFRFKIARTFKNYTKVDPEIGVPTNIEAIALTETRSVVDDIKHRYMERLVDQNPKMRARKRWIHHPSMSKEPRPGHAAMHMKEIDIDDLFEVPVFVKEGGKWVRTGEIVLMAHPHDSHGEAEDVINCIPGDTLVVTPQTKALMRGCYRGNMITVRTKGGLEFSVTPNHPVLTDQGWIEAKGLEVGSNVICMDRGDLLPGSKPDVQDRPAMIRQIFDFPPIGGMFSFHGIARTDAQFHGERENRQVDVKTINRLLWDHGETVGLKHLLQLFLALADKIRAVFSAPSFFFEMFGRHGLVSQGIMGCAGESPLPLGRKPLHPQGVGLGTTTSWDAEPDQFTLDRVAIDPVVKGERVFGFAGTVAPDEIVEIRSKFFTGHVYNLSTQSGMYAVKRNNNIHKYAILHNCHCDTEYIVRMATKKRKKLS